jgi:hypothetical protein
MEFPPPSQQQVELLELDREIARRQVELNALIEKRTSLTPIPQMPPPQGRPLQTTSGTDGAKLVFALGAVVLMAAVASFAGFVWPHLTLPLRTAALTLLVVLLGGAAVYAKPRLISLAEALAATGGVSTVVLTTWFYTASTTNQSTFGVGVALGAAALAVGAAAHFGKLQAWVWTASATAPLAALYMTAGVEHHYVVAFLAAAVFAGLAWKLRWFQMVWASGALLAIALLTASFKLHDLGAGYSLPYVAALVLAASLAVNRPPATPCRNVLGVAVVNAAIAALVGVMLWGTAVANKAVLVERLDVSALLVAFAICVYCTVQRQRDELVRILLVLAVVAASANLSPLVTVAITLLAVPLCASPAAAIVFAAALSATAARTDTGTVLSGDTPVWLILCLAALLPTWAAFKRRDQISTLVGAFFATAAATAISIDVLHLTSPEVIGGIVAVVLGSYWVFARARTEAPVPSWWAMPALFAALGPATLRSLEHTDTASLLRTSVVLSLGSAFIAYGAHRRFGGFVFAPGACIAIIAAVRILDAASHVPVWIPLVVGGVVLLAIGARFERLQGPRQRAASWVSTLE